MESTRHQDARHRLIADDKPVFLVVDGERKHIDRVDEYDTEVLIIPNGDVVIDEGR